MAYGNGVFSHIKALARAGYLRGGDRVLELGSQVVAEALDPNEIVRFIEAVDPARSPDAAQRAEIARTIDERSYVMPFFQMAGLGYVALDLSPAPGTRIFDLNDGAVPVAETGAYALVTNLGTSEHVFNQTNTFKIVHDALKVGGCAIHFVPFHGYWNHGLVNYQPKFFALLALANGYEIIHFMVSGPIRCGEERLQAATSLPGSAHWATIESESGMMMAILRKTKDAPFRMGLDSVGNVDVEKVFATIDATIGALGAKMSAHAALV